MSARPLPQAFASHLLAGAEERAAILAAMLQAIQVGREALGDYASIIERGLADEIRELAEPLAGVRVLHLSSSAFGGGVAEIMYALIPLMRDVGLDVEWRVMHGEPEFFDVTKAIHNGLQGAEKPLSQTDHATFERYNALNILSNLNNVGAVEVNAFQVASQVFVQKSIRERFGLTVTEALWKRKPTVAGRVGGIVDQVKHGETGYLVSSPEECAAACTEVLEDADAARAMALRGKEHVRRHFLMPRLLRDWISLFARLDSGGSDRDQSARGPRGA